MATIIDSLIITLGLNTQGFTAQGNAATKQLAGMQKQTTATTGAVSNLGTTSKKASSGVESLTKALGSMLALIGGTYAIKTFIEDTINSSAALERLSRNLNVSAGQITAWGNVVEQGGGSAKGLQSTLSMLSKEQTNLALTGQSSLIPMFNMLGVSMFNAQGQALKSTEILKQLASATEGKDRRTMFNLLTSSGIDEGTANTLLRGRKELELNIAAQKEYAEQINKFAPIAEKMQKSIIALKQHFTLLGLELLQKAAPSIEKFIGVLTGVSDWVLAHGEFVTDFLKALGVGFAALTIATAPITLAIAAVLLLAGAIALLVEDYQKWKEGGDTLIDWEKWKPGLDASRKAIGHWAHAVGLSFKSVIYEAMAAHDVLTGDWGSAWNNMKTSDNAARDSVDYVWEGMKDVIRGSQGVQDASKRAKSDTVTDAYAMQHFKNRGFSDEEAAGLTANIDAESGGGTRKVGDNGQAFGILQWHPDRQKDFKDLYGYEMKDSPNIADDELDFMVHELMVGKERNNQAKIAAAKSASESGSLISRNYVRPKDVEGEADKRGRRAAFLAKQNSNLIYGVNGASDILQSANQSGLKDPSVPTDNSTTITMHNVTIQADNPTQLVEQLNSFAYTYTGQANTGLK